METYYIQRGTDQAVNIYDRYKVEIRSIVSLDSSEEVELGNNTAMFNTIAKIAVHPNQMNALSSFTNYIRSKIKGQYNKAVRGETKDGAFQLINTDTATGYRLSYVSIRDTGEKSGKWKLLEILFMNEVPHSTLIVSDNLFIGNSACDIYFPDGTFLNGIHNRLVLNPCDWALVVQDNKTSFDNNSSVFGGTEYIDNSQMVELKDGVHILRCVISHNGQDYPIASYDMGQSWVMSKPIMQEFINRKEAVVKFPADIPVMYYAKEILPEIEMPEGFCMLESKDILALREVLEKESLHSDFYNKSGLYGFVEYLSLNTKTPRAAFWCKNKNGEITGFQFIQKGERVVIEHIHVESYTYLPIIGIYKN